MVFVLQPQEQQHCHVADGQSTDGDLKRQIYEHPAHLLGRRSESPQQSDEPFLVKNDYEQS